MAFSSIPTYSLDAPNWQQFPNHQFLMNTGMNNHSPSLSAPTTPPAAALQQVHGSSGGSIKPGSMAERARLANIPMPEMALKCPRCESTNTKFCYFNNYSLTQPRHFCKTCRRYWTRGGAMRNVPVGGSCRRNNKKSSKSNNKSKSTSRSECQSGGIGSTSITTTQTNGGCGSGDTMLALSGQVSPPPRFMASNLVHHLGDNSFTFGGEINGLNNYGQIISPAGGPGYLNFHFGGPSDPHSNLGFYPFGGGSLIESSGLSGGASRMEEKMLGYGTLLQLSSVKLEDNQELNLSRRFLGMPMPGNGQHLNGSSSAWTDMCTGFSSSSTTCRDTA